MQDLGAEIRELHCLVKRKVLDRNRVGDLSRVRRVHAVGVFPKGHACTLEEAGQNRRRVIAAAAFQGRRCARVGGGDESRRDYQRGRTGTLVQAGALGGLSGPPVIVVGLHSVPTETDVTRRRNVSFLPKSGARIACRRHHDEFTRIHPINVQRAFAVMTLQVRAQGVHGPQLTVGCHDFQGYRRDCARDVNSPQQDLDATGILSNTFLDIVLKRRRRGRRNDGGNRFQLPRDDAL